jgi:hypothetical protein
LKTINLVENEHLVVIVSDRNAPYEDSTVVFLVSPERGVSKEQKCLSLKVSKLETKLLK